MQLLELAAGLDPQLLDERSAGVGVRLEGIRLAPASVEREHELAPQPLAKRMARDQLSQLGGELRTPSPVEVRRHPVLEHRQPQLLQAGDLPLGEALVREVGEGRAAPHLERLSQLRRGAVAVAGGERLAPLCRGALEAVEVELPRLEPQLITGRAGEEHPALTAGGTIGLQHLPEP